MSRIIINAASNRKAIAHLDEIDSYKSFHIQVYYTGKLYDYDDFNEYRAMRDRLKHKGIPFNSWGFYKYNGERTIFTSYCPDICFEIRPLKQEIESANGIDDKAKFYLYESIGKRQEILNTTKEKY